MKIINYSTLLIALAGLILALYATVKKPGVAFVRTHFLMENYKGTEEAFQKLEKFKALGTMRMDSLEKELRLETENYKRDSLHYSPSEKIRRREKIRSLQYSWYQAGKDLEERYAEKDQQLSSGLMTQVNQYLNEYAEKAGYELILGTGNGENVLYGKEKLDITEDLLKELNNKYTHGSR